MPGVSVAASLVAPRAFLLEARRSAAHQARAYPPPLLLVFVLVVVVAIMAPRSFRAYRDQADQRSQTDGAHQAQV